MTYQCADKDGKSFRNTEFFTFEGDRVRRIDVYFGATYAHGMFVKQQALKKRRTCRVGSDLVRPSREYG